MVKLTPRERYAFKNTLEKLASYKGRNTELITLLIPPTKQISDVANYLRNELGQSSNIKSKTTRKNVTSAIESILSRLRTFKTAPENGLAFFVGHIPVGADQTRMIAHVIEPPSPISTFLYRCDSYFYLDHLKEMLAEEDIYGLIVIDRKEATLGLLKGRRVETIKNVQSLVPSKHGKGGQSRLRFERLIEIAAHEYFKKIGDLCTEAFLGIEGLKGILVGGPGATKDFFVHNDYLHHELKKKVLDTFDTGYTDESGLNELIEKARPALQHLEVAKERELMDRLFSEIRKEDGGLSAYGEAEVKAALEAGAVEILLVSEEMRMMHRVFECPSCGKRYEIDQKRTDEPIFSCPDDQNLCQFVEEKDMVEELGRICEMYSTTLELISSDSSEGQMLLKAFGGIAAILRYRFNGG
ncbi:MAG TPA: peptide chain release factor 1 [Euryarchaeota archaeon]|nr:MAG: peptide chain release factor 1 [Thermoplasmatales archaeon ex4484_6]RLF68825.1 MAG: peptide chain release factor 1 [Thermoplasmata archaeon]HHD15820.1 peptide chain release factor 1 [Euryarchaeota archaeon]